MFNNRRKLRAGWITGLALLSSSIVSGATFTTSDGMISIDAPSDQWVQADSPAYWFSMTDGNDMITIEKLSDTAVLSDMLSKNDSYQATCQAVISVDDELYIIKGASAAADHFDEIMRSIGTVKILKYQDAAASEAAPAAPSPEEFSIRSMDETYYVTAYFLNVRSSYSVDSKQLDTFTLGKPVKVTGAVTLNGQDYGWYQIDYNGGNAYVSSQFLTATAFEVTPAPAQTMTLYRKDGTAVKVTLTADGYWKDEAGIIYWLENDATGEWKNEKEEILTKTYTAPSTASSETYSDELVTAASGSGTEAEGSTDSSDSSEAIYNHTTSGEASSYTESEAESYSSSSSDSYDNDSADSSESSDSYVEPEETSMEEDEDPGDPADMESSSYSETELNDDYLDGIDEDEDTDMEIVNVDDIGNETDGSEETEYTEDESAGAADTSDPGSYTSLVDPLQ